MSDLSFLEKTQLERQFAMGGGYVLDFSNRTFAEFVLDCTGRDIYDAKYEYASGSKANRLRAFWTEEPNHVVGKLVADLLAYSSSGREEGGGDPQFQQCRKIAARLLQSSPVEHIDAVDIGSAGRDFEVLSRAVREAIDKNEPESGLDRLHTFVLKYVRRLCSAKGIDVDRGKPLHAIFGEYVKALRKDGLIDSEMTIRILKSSIGTMEAFNRVRNEQSLAHDNPVLNYDEALLIFNHVCSSVRFLRQLEERACAAHDDECQPREWDEDEIPF